MSNQICRSTSSSTTTMMMIGCMLFFLQAANAFLPTTMTSHTTMSRRGEIRMMSAAAASSSSGVPPAAAAAAAKRPRREINVLQVIESKGGYMARLQVKNFNDASQHTIITSRDLYQETIQLAGKPDFSIEDYFKAVIKFMLARGMSLANTEGMIDAGIFPINYFSVAQLAHFMDDTVSGVAEQIKDM